MSINLTVSGNKNIDMRIPKRGSINPQPGNAVIIDHAEYTGDYLVIPDDFQHVLETNDKLMKGDVIVEKIPYYETSNISGTTVYIGG